MADFSVNATQLSAPQGAGSQPLQAVAPVDNSQMYKVAGSIVDIFEQGVKNNRKQEAADLQKSVVNGYIREVATVNDAIASGGVSPAEARIRTRAIFNKYAAGYGEYIEDFDKAAKAFKGQSELGEAEDIVAEIRELSTSTKRSKGVV